MPKQPSSHSSRKPRKSIRNQENTIDPSSINDDIVVDSKFKGSARGSIYDEDGDKSERLNTISRGRISIKDGTKESVS